MRETAKTGGQLPKANQTTTRAQISEKDLGWRLMDGKRQTIADYKGKAVILDFWATYCPPCIEGIPHFNDLKKRYEAQGLEVIGLNVGGTEDHPKIPAFVEQLKISYPLGYPDDALTDFYFEGDTRIPQTLVFDRNGQLVQQFVGFDNDVKTQLDKSVLEALKN